MKRDVYTVLLSLCSTVHLRMSCVCCSLRLPTLRSLLTLSLTLPLQKLALRRPAGKDSERYYQDLQQQAEERHRSRVLEREEDRRLAQQVLLGLCALCKETLAMGGGGWRTSGALLVCNCLCHPFCLHVRRYGNVSS